MRARFELLTAREKQVIGLVAAGLTNKQIAAKIGISNVTAKVHRANIMRKMKAHSLVELLRMADLLGAGAGNLRHALVCDPGDPHLAIKSSAPLPLGELTSILVPVGMLELEVG